eukprot:symbB.v1.2.003354.t1/scaffold186.1/size279346/1
MVHVRTGLSFPLRVPKSTTIHQLKICLIAVVKKKIGRDARIDAPDDIFVFQGNRHCSKADVVEHLQLQDDFAVVYYIQKSDFTSEASDPVHAGVGSSSPVAAVAEDASSVSEDEEEEEVYEETDFASGAVPASEAVIEEETTQPTVSETAEPEDEPTSLHWTLILEFTVANINQHVDLNISPDANLTSLRKRIAEVVFANNPKKTQKLMSGKDLVLTALNPESTIGSGNMKVKTVLIDGRHIRVAFRALGGGKSAKAKGVKKDVGGKTTRYGQMVQDANSKIQMDTIKNLPSIAKAEQVMTAFSSEVEQSPQDALLKVFMTMPMEKLNTSIQILNQKGGKMEAKISMIAIDVFDLEQVVASKTSLESVIDASSAVLLYGISKMGANDTRNEAHAVKALLERALYIKQGQQSMGGYSTAPTNDADL